MKSNKRILQLEDPDLSQYKCNLIQSAGVSLANPVLSHEFNEGKVVSND